MSSGPHLSTICETFYQVIVQVSQTQQEIQNDYLFPNSLSFFCFSFLNDYYHFSFHILKFSSDSHRNIPFTFYVENGKTLCWSRGRLPGMEGLGSHMKPCFLYFKSTEEQLKDLDKAWSILYHAEMTLEVALKDLRANKGIFHGQRGYEFGLD